MKNIYAYSKEVTHFIQTGKNVRDSNRILQKITILFASHLTLVKHLLNKM